MRTLGHSILVLWLLAGRPKILYNSEKASRSASKGVPWPQHPQAENGLTRIPGSFLLRFPSCFVLPDTLGERKKKRKEKKGGIEAPEPLGMDAFEVVDMKYSILPIGRELQPCLVQILDTEDFGARPLVGFN